MAHKVTSMVVVIRGKEYDVIPGGTCNDCAFKASCLRSSNLSAPTLSAPTVDGHVLCTDIDVVFKKRGKSK